MAAAASAPAPLSGTPGDAAGTDRLRRRAYCVSPIAARTAYPMGRRVYDDTAVPPAQLVDTLRRRRNELGISYVTLSAAFCEQFAPAVEMLAGT